MGIDGTALLTTTISVFTRHSKNCAKRPTLDETAKLYAFFRRFLPWGRNASDHISFDVTADALDAWVSSCNHSANTLKFEKDRRVDKDKFGAGTQSACDCPLSAAW